MQSRFLTMVLATVCLAFAPGCGSKRTKPAPDAAQVKQPTMGVTVAVSTEPRFRPRLTLGPGLLGTNRPRPQAMGSLKLTAERCRLEGATFLNTRKDPPVRALEVVGRHLYVIARQARDCPGAFQHRLVLQNQWDREIDLKPGVRPNRGQEPKRSSSP